MLKFRVEGQKLTWENPDEVVVAGTKKYLECYFEFDGDEWSGFEHIDVFFKNGRGKPVQMLLVGNRIRKEDGLCLAAGDWAVYLCATTYNDDGVEIDKQMTSSSVSIRVLAHGQFDNAQNSFESPEIANQYIAQMLDAEKGEAARNVFEEYDPVKEYVRGNKVAFEGSSYVLIAERALGINPTDTESWLCIAEKGDKGEQGLQGIKGDKGDKGDKGVIGGKIFSYALGYGKDVEVGSYKMDLPPDELINEGIDYEDIIIDTDGGCIFQYVPEIGGDGDDGASLPAEGLHCIANPNGEKGDKGDKGKDGTLWTPLYFELDIKKGENKKAKFDFNRNILYWGSAEYDGLNKDDYPNVYEWTVGDFFVSNDRKILQITHLEWPNSELLNADVTCISEHNLIVDQVFDGDSENAVSGKALAEVLKVLSEQLAFADFSNVSNEDFKAKAEEAGVGGDAPMVFKGVVSELPNTVNEGEVYKITNTTTSNLYVRHNGEWVEIWESGVTKSEMESYIEETILGGEW